jgi:hypothetical protein
MLNGIGASRPALQCRLMTEKKNRTAFVVVQKEWFNHGMRALTGHESQSERDAHVMICTVDDMADHLGLWIRDVTSHYRKNDAGPFVKMRLMIPWQFVLSVGLVDDKMKIPTGFQNTTVLTQSE